MNKQSIDQTKQLETQTLNDLRSILHSDFGRSLSTLSLPEIDTLVREIAERTPAGNVPGMILNGLARIPNRMAPKPQEVQQGVQLLFRGIEQKLAHVRDQALFGAVFGAPAAVISTYQRLLKLAGIRPESAFPNGIWQFYVDYALRDDHARHAHESHGFDTALQQHNIHLNPIDRLTAWVLTAAHTLHTYPRLLECEWRERVYIRTAQELAHGTRRQPYFDQLYRQWEERRPYSRGNNVDPQDDYATYRTKQFDHFFAEAIRVLPRRKRNEWAILIQQAKIDQLPAYQQQMSISAYLQPEIYSERHVPLTPEQTHVALYVQGHYYLLPICQPDGRTPIDAHTIREQIATIITHPETAPPTNLQSLARTNRRAFSLIRTKLSPSLQSDLDACRVAPIILNFDPQRPNQPLAQLRETERGVGDHPLTIIDNGHTFVFDQSHIFFDGAWGAALAEIMTNEALAWGAYLHTLPAASLSTVRPYSPALQLTASDEALINKTSKVAPTVSAESNEIDVKKISQLRTRFKQRNDLITLTVNDLLVLYRAIHAVTYQANQPIQKRLASLTDQRATHAAATAAIKEIDHSHKRNPVMLIPIDASQRSPQDRLYPITFEVPLADLGLYELHKHTIKNLRQAQQTKSRADRRAFAAAQRDYLSILAGFGKVLSRAKEVALAGESNSATALKLIANLPKPLQNLLDRIPDSVDVINDLIKGREVFSNIGRVAPQSSLRRFSTAKDDNDKKWLCWGVLTNAENVMTITLRDFRPHVGQLHAIGQKELAQQITQDYLDAYVTGFNRFIHDLKQITTEKT